jgi:ribonuclease HI
MSTATLPLVLLFTDGACSGNPGPGGWAFILRHPASGKERERSGGDPQTTNNRMELLAVIEGLTALKAPSKVELYSDSQYVLNGLRELMSSHELTFHWVEGHAGHPENERCDQLAVAARDAAAASGMR